MQSSESQYQDFKINTKRNWEPVKDFKNGRNISPSVGPSRQSSRILDLLQIRGMASSEATTNSSVLSAFNCRVFAPSQCFIFTRQFIKEFYFWNSETLKEQYS
ncbi:hypothetical protein ILYODFUR_034582 [Ilyodon furcidens]|uniref:Uncharacterized protein n=1 Tax=Ilyodon furcidens TaxID=33524 RepID=A0ABV0ULT7_9TELE